MTTIHQDTCMTHFVAQFTGKERDAESGLDYFGARHYASTMGRFMQADEPFADQDTSDPQSWNMYLYAVNNPLRFTDPSGMAHNDPNGFWVGDYNGECGQQNGTTMCWNASAANGKGEWQAPPQAHTEQNQQRDSGDSDTHSLHAGSTMISSSFALGIRLIGVPSSL